MKTEEFKFLRFWLQIGLTPGIKFSSVIQHDELAALIVKHVMGPAIEGLEGTLHGHDTIDVDKAIKYLNNCQYSDKIAKILHTFYAFLELCCPRITAAIGDDGNFDNTSMVLRMFAPPKKAIVTKCFGDLD
ncbi:uncharacterized protein MELLADRAFT_102588 [Melampsora larici-populina 98AG31]|uniref:Uncharacterized protein n=1 Tax=Melampsora larici-populina (strain 98AG31 / pathotype 3-4-7) TaxID=747676 RepID=F4R798_MELLP|nr:uncharacterized protein MELLADRAFT_102588 [Melampsora larici-populina 98AG31]EGG11553.1 hypothetical protein MELLADRAFT_102588 [Melampsora larici-populina 98AG31]